MSTADGFPGVWSEKPEPRGPGGYGYDCGYSTVLTQLAYAGFTRFPLGPYTVEEREALESSDDRKDETGAFMRDVDIAVLRRYRLVLRKVATPNLAAALTKPNQMLHVQGTGYGGPHSYAVETAPGWDGTIPSGSCRKYDPMRPMHDRGFIVTNASVVADHLALGYGAELRIVGIGEFAAQEEDMKITAARDETWTSVASNGVLRREPKRAAPLIATADGKPLRYVAGTDLRVVARVETDDPINKLWGVTDYAGAPAFLLISGGTDWKLLGPWVDPAIADARGLALKDAAAALAALK